MHSKAGHGFMQATHEFTVSVLISSLIHTSNSQLGSEWQCVYLQGTLVDSIYIQMSQLNYEAMQVIANTYIRSQLCTHVGIASYIFLNCERFKFGTNTVYTFAYGTIQLQLHTCVISDAWQHTCFNVEKIVIMHIPTNSHD